jgi:AraC-like DNA-binding protein
MQNQSCLILWVNLCLIPENAIQFPFTDKALSHITIQYISKAQVSKAMHALNKPQLICLDYDYPTLHDLQLLRWLRQNHPRIPVIMLTKRSTESLAIWAFRTGVRDYFVKLDCENLLAQLLARIVPLTASLVQNQDFARQNLLPSPLIPCEFRNDSLPESAFRTSLALVYVATHFESKIHQKAIAAQCGMTIFAFSKSFHKEYGMTFSEYVLRYRIERAKELLCNPMMSITDIAVTVGFNDASSFGRSFKRFVKQTPSMYRDALAQAS